MNAIQAPVDTTSADMEARFQRSQALLQGFGTQTLVQNDRLLPHWIGQTDCFWYQRTHETGYEYRLVDANANSNQPAFDHAAIAKALSTAERQDVNAENLPIENVSIGISPLTVQFTAFSKHWCYEESNGTCNEVNVLAVAANEELSPDGRWIAFARDHNLWVRDVSNGEERALTSDGEEYYSYAAPSTPRGMTDTDSLSALWSPDSQRLFVLQRDTRQVKTTPVVDSVPQDGSIRPTVKHLKVAYPGDVSVEQYRLLSINISNAHQCEANYRHITSSWSHCIFFQFRLGWWASDSRRAYFIDRTRDERMVRVVEFDTDNGATRILFEEHSDTHVNVCWPEVKDLAHHIYLPDTDELVWWSERSGWGQLYLYDLTTGTLKHRVTEGDWRIRDILHVDPVRRELWIQTAARVMGRNPYLRDLCRVHLDTGELTTLLSTDDDYNVHYPDANIVRLGVRDPQLTGVSPSGNYIVTTRSRTDKVPEALLLNRAGEIVLQLETTDISKLPTGWQWPESVKMTAADGHTDIYGVLFRPSDFDEAKQYPVINMIVSGPWLAAVPHGSFHNSRSYADLYYFQGTALAELGYMVVVIDSRGTPLRSKAFQDESYGWIPSSANTDDHLSAIEQLAQRYPSMDVNRVAIFGPSGYQSSIQNLMECPDFYKVGVINMLQDSRLIGCTAEADKFHGIDGPAEGQCFPEELVDDFKSNLLLFHPLGGPYAEGYIVAAPFRLVEALREANKNVDLLMIPTRALAGGEYEMRRTWEYLLKYL